MSERVKLFKKLRDSVGSRLAYTKAIVSVNVSSQIRSLRLRRSMTQEELASSAGMKQARISILERPGESLSIETLIRLAAAFRVGLIVKFVPFSEMFSWKNSYAPDAFDATPIDKDSEFINPTGTSSDLASTAILTSGTSATGYMLQPSDSTSPSFHSREDAMGEESVPLVLLSRKISLSDIPPQELSRA